jgi:steroid 5-alpha reductase family enzyme
MNYYLILAITLLVFVHLWFVISLITKRNDVADIAWGLGFIVLTWTSFFIGGQAGTRSVITAILISVWGIRLAWHIHTRNKGKEEDYRYLAWRQQWGKWFLLRSYFQVFILQGAFLYIISLPILYINKSVNSPLIWLDIVGIAIWMFGFYFEALGDAQLVRFKKNPNNKGKLMQDGLWAYTRHPNYFGEVVQWWGIGIIALSVQGGWMGMIGPITITYLIVKVSGIPMLENKMQFHPDFANYTQKANAFFPRIVFTKKNK